MDELGIGGAELTVREDDVWVTLRLLKQRSVPFPKVWWRRGHDIV